MLVLSAAMSLLMSFTILGPAFFGSFSWSPKRHHKAAVLSHSRQTDIDTKKPAGLTPCGLLGLHRMTLVITAGEFWWAGVPVLLIIVY